MSKSPNSLTFSRMLGMEDRFAQANPQHVAMAFNVDFQNGIMSRRPGRQILLDSTKIRPTKVLWYNGTTMADVTKLCTDGDTGTVAITNPFGAANSAIYIGMPYRFYGINVSVSTPMSSTTSMVVKVFNRTTGTGIWNTTTGFSDGTVSGGGTLKISGLVLWQGTTWTNWTPGAAGVTGIADTAIDQDLFWIQITTNATGTGGIAEFSCDFGDMLNFSFPAMHRGTPQGVIEYASRTGERSIAITADWGTAPFEARSFIVDLGRGDYVPLRMPKEFRQEVDPDQTTSFVTFNGWLIGSTSTGYLWKYNYDSCTPLECLPGLDAQNNIVGAQPYFLKTPRGTKLEIYRNRLFVTGDPYSPMTFYGSLEDNNISTIPSNATVGGPNVWPLRNAFNVPGREGDKIMNMAVINDRLVVFTRTQTWVFDDSSLRLIDGDVGCVAANSIQKADNLIYFLSDLGIFVTDGATVKNISGPIWNTLTSMLNWQSANRCSSSHDRSRGEYRLYTPINASPYNSCAVVYDYVNSAWSFAGGYYFFADDQLMFNNGVQMAITASCQAVSSSGRQIVISGDLTGIMWQENVGYTDGEYPYPAFVVFPSLSSFANDAERDRTFRDWYLTVPMDGTYIECLALANGDSVERALTHRITGVTTSPPVTSSAVIKRALFQNSVNGSNWITQNFTDNPAYSNLGDATQFNKITGQFQKLKFSFAKTMAKFQPVIHWPTGNFNGSGYDTTTGTASRASIFDVQLDVSSVRTAR